MQFPAIAKPPVGILFDSAMDRIDDVLALAMLHGFEGKDQARIAALCVSNANLQAAQFCDAVRLFYASATTGTAAMYMHSTPVGLAESTPAARAPMLAVAEQSTVKNIRDTADVTTLMRNAMTGFHDQNAAVVLSGPATDLAQLLEMNGVRDLVARKVRLLCVTEPGLEADAASARKVMDNWPGPIVTVGREVGEVLKFPGESIEKDFAYTSPHPIAEAYRAYRQMPYDAPSWAMAAMLYTVRPKENFFKVSNRRLEVDPEQKERVIRAYIELASAKPVPRKPRHSVDKKKADEKEAEEKKKEER